MNILQILPEMNVGGVETGTVDFARYLVQKGHHSVVVSNGGFLVEKIEKGGSLHYSLPVHKKSLWRMIKCVGPLREIIKKEKIDVVHARSRVPGWIAFFATRKTKAAFITTCHGYYRNRFFSQVMGWAKIVIVPSEMIAKHMMDHYQVRADTIRCIPRSVDLKRFSVSRKGKSSGEMIISIVGRITPLKGHPYFLRAMQKVVRHYPYAKIWIIGSVPPKKKSYQSELESLVHRLNLQDHVSFLGSRADVPELLAQTDILCFSSTEPESFGRAILEAQAAGVPVVATSVGGVVDIIDDGLTGQLVIPKDVDGMAEAVIRYIKSPKLRESVVQASQDKIKRKFTVAHMAKATLIAYEELLDSQNVLVMKLSSMGDVVLITASLKAIRKKFPQAKIYCLVGKESRKILQGCPHLDGLILFDNTQKGWGQVWKLANKLRRLHFDQVIDFQNNRRSHCLSFLSFPKQSIGFDNKKWSWMLTDPLKNYRNDIPAVAHQFQLLNQLNIKWQNNYYLELWPTKKDQQYVQDLLEGEWLGQGGVIVGINVAASVKWKTKNWPADHISNLCDKLAAKNIRVVLTGVEKDRPVGEYVMERAKSKPANLIGKTDILQLAVLISKCKVYITPDSAPLHVAAAMQVPVITFFGPTDSSRHIPPAKKIVILEKKVPCAPCYSRRCKIGTHECMEEITPKEVFDEVMGFMEVPA